MKIPNVFREIDPTRGNIVKNATIMTTPLWINTVFWMLIHSLNLYWVSRIGTEAIAAVAIGGAAFMMLIAPIQGIVTATFGMVGSFNRQDPPGLDRLVKQILSTTWILSILLAGLGYFLAPSLLGILGAEPEIVSLAVTYLRICAIGGLISLSFWSINDMIRATRDMFRPMLFMGLLLILQGIFDYLFILGNLGFPKMGVAGAGLSVALSAAIGALVVFWMLVKGKLFIKVDFKRWRDFRIRFETIKEVAKIAGFDTIEGLTRTAAGMVMLAIVAPFGTAALAAFAIGQRFFRYASVFGMDLGKTTAITMSNNLGAGNIKRAEKSTWLICGMGIAIMGFFGLLFFVFAGQILSLFSQDPEVLAIGIRYLRFTTLFGLGYAFFALGIVLQRAFAGAKDTRTPMLIYWLMAGIQIGLAIALPKFFNPGINGVWIALFIGMVFYGLALSLLFKMGRWRKHAGENT